MHTDPPFSDPAVQAKFAAFPDPLRAGLMQLRALIFEVAATTPGVGAVHETLKWGQPAYLTPDTKSGSTLRLGLPKQGGFAIYAHCQTTIIRDFAQAFPDTFTVEGIRAVQFAPGQAVPPDPLRLLNRHALTYHQKQP